MDLLEKLKAILAEKGIDEEIQTEILAELDGKPEGQPEGEAVPDETEIQPTPEGEEGEPKENPEEVPPVEEPSAPVEPEELPPELPEADPLADLKGQYDDLNGKYEEAQKTIEALLARVDSLEEALRASGVIEGEKPVTYGVDKPTAPANDPIDDGLDDFFRKANRKF